MAKNTEEENAQARGIVMIVGIAAICVAVGIAHGPGTALGIFGAICIGFVILSAL